MSASSDDIRGVRAQLLWRYSTKKFDPARPIPAPTWAALEDSLHLSPSSYGLQPWRFVVITDRAVKAKLPAISWNQSQTRDCSHLVVFAARRGINATDVQNHIEHIARTHAVPLDSLHDYQAQMLGTLANTPAPELDEWCARQAYIALGFFLSAAAALHVDTCALEGIDCGAYDALLNLPSRGYATVCAAAAGFRADDDWLASLPKVRFEAADIFIRV